MEILEAALKHSIFWSIENRSERKKPENREPCCSRAVVEQMNEKVSDEAHIRAFITHFKIHLNNLVASNDVQQREQATDVEDDNSLSDRDSIDTDTDELPTIHVQYGAGKRFDSTSSLPLIKINGKHFGLYNISEQTDEEQPVDQEIIKELHSKQINTIADSDIDDGYRSLSRGSFRSNIVQQLNEIKSRLIDLINEIDLNVESKLSQDDLDAYRKRRNALITKLNSLIDSNLHKIESSSMANVDLVDNNNICQSSSSETSSLEKRKSSSNSSPADCNEAYSSTEYEEQVQVIDFDSKSDRIATKNQQPLIVNSNTTKINLCRVTEFDHFLNKRQPIDFGAMMRDYENSKQKGNPSNEQTNETQQDPMIIKNQVQHVPSVSSTSSYSASSHTSSSSFL